MSADADVAGLVAGEAAVPADVRLGCNSIDISSVLESANILVASKCFFAYSIAFSEIS